MNRIRLIKVSLLKVVDLGVHGKNASGQSMFAGFTRT